MSTIETKRLGQRVVSGTTQPLLIGGILADGSDAKITVDASGNVVLPSTTTIGAVSDVELGHLAGITSNVQVQLDAIKGNVGLGSSVYGLIYNKTSDTYKRFGTGTVEDTVWMSTLSGRMNENSNSDAVTAFFNSADTVQGNMKRVVVSNTGAYVKDYNATNYTHADQVNLTATQSVMVQIPKFYYISIQFVYTSETYNLFAQSLAPFSIELTSMGFGTASSITGQNATGYVSYGSITGTVVTSVVHNAFNYNDGSVKNTLFVGAFKSYNVGGIARSTCTTTGTSTPIKATATQTIANFRTQHSAFGAKFSTYNWFEREAIALCVIVERGTFQTEVNGLSTTTKWEGYSWNTSGSSDDQNLGQTLKFLNSTGVIRNASNQTIANTYRGIEGYHSHLWEFVDGINIINGVVWLAKHGATYASDTTASPYFTSGKTVPTTGSGVYISDTYAGTFLPSATAGSSTTKMTDGGWFATGNMVLIVGGNLSNPGTSGAVSWNCSNASSNSGWTIGGRFSALA